MKDDEIDYGKIEELGNLISESMLANAEKNRYWSLTRSMNRMKRVAKLIEIGAPRLFILLVLKSLNESLAELQHYMAVYYDPSNPIPCKDWDFSELDDTDE